MASNIVFNGVTYSMPADGDNNWGPDLTAYFIAIASAALQKTGGTFTLTAEAAFGATYGLKSAYLKSYATNPAAAGAVRLGNTESVSFRNNANTADLALTSNASDALLFNSKNVLFSALGLIVNADVNASAAIAYSKLNLATSIVNADIAVGAAIAYSKLNLATSIVNADIGAAAAIAYSKLNLTGLVVNADIAAAAAIALTKLAATSFSRALVSDASGFVSVATTTATEIGYVNGVTSAIQTQLTANRPMTTGGDIVYGGASGVPTRLANGSAYQTLQSNGTTVAPTWVNQKVLQVVNTTTGAVATGTTVIPADDTIPQNTEGDQYMSLAITPLKSTSSLQIQVVATASASVASTLIAALFRDATAGAIGVSVQYQATVTGQSTIAFTVIAPSTATSATTFKVRMGPQSAGTLTFNGAGGGRFFGGIMASSITITEYEN